MEFKIYPTKFGHLIATLSEPTKRSNQLIFYNCFVKVGDFDWQYREEFRGSRCSFRPSYRDNLNLEFP